MSATNDNKERAPGEPAYLPETDPDREQHM